MARITSTPFFFERKSRLTKNTIEGDAARAFRKTSRTAFSDSPTHLLKS